MLGPKAFKLELKGGSKLEFRRVPSSLISGFKGLLGILKKSIKYISLNIKH